MAFRTFAVTVGAVPVQVLRARPGDLEVVLRAGSTVLIGGPDVSETTGLWVGPLCNDGEFRTTIRPGDELWAVAPAATDVRILVRTA